jgi:hypothetical protein
MFEGVIAKTSKICVAASQPRPRDKLPSRGYLTRAVKPPDRADVASEGNAWHTVQRSSAILRLRQKGFGFRWRQDRFSVSSESKCKILWSGFQWEPALQIYTPVDSLTLYRTNKTMRKYRGDASIENQLKIDSIQNLLPLTLLKVKIFWI